MSNQKLIQSNENIYNRDGSYRTSGFINPYKKGTETLGAIDANIQTPFIINPSIFDFEPPQSNQYR